MNLAKFDSVTEDMAHGRIDWPNDTVLTYLSLRQPQRTDTTLSEIESIASNSYSAATMSGKAISQTDGVATLRAEPIRLETFGGNVSFQFVVFVNASNDDKPMLWCGLPNATTVIPGVLTIGQADADGLFNLSTLQ